MKAFTSGPRTRPPCTAPKRPRSVHTYTPRYVATAKAPYSLKRTPARALLARIHCSGEAGPAGGAAEGSGLRAGGGGSRWGPEGEEGGAPTR